MESVDLTALKYYLVALMEAVLFCGAQIGQQGRKSLIAGVDACALFGYALIIGNRGGRSNYFDGLGSIDYFYESNRYFLPVTLDPITCQFHCDMG